VLDENNVVGAAPAGAVPITNAAPATRLVAATALARRRIVTPWLTRPPQASGTTGRRGR
jgi:hypothetical protein